MMLSLDPVILLLTKSKTLDNNCSCGSVEEHCVSSAKWRGFNSKGTHILIRKFINCIAWMHCKSLWIKASAKCINVNNWVTLYNKVSFIKQLVHFQNKKILIIYLPPCHPRFSCLSIFSRKEIKVLRKTFQDFSPYSGLQWEPTGWRSELQFQRTLHDPSW